MIGRRRAGLLVVGLALAAGLGALPGERGLAVAADPCAVPAELRQVDARLPHVEARLRSGDPVTIVAIGGGSTAGAAAGAPDLAYPARLQRSLRRLFPAVEITVLNKGVPRQTAQQMVARFSRDVVAARPALAIWETGISDAVRGTEIDDFADTLQAGLDLLKAKAIDVILVDLQFSRRTAMIIDFEQYLTALHRVAEANGLYLFPRYEMMRYWSEAGVFDFDSVPRTDRAALAARVYDCLGRRLADAIRRAVR